MTTLNKPTIKLDADQIRGLIYYEYKKGSDAKLSTIRLNEAFGADTFNEATVRRFHKQFDDGDVPHIGPRQRPFKLDDDTLLDYVDEHPTENLSELVRALGYARTTIQQHLRDLEYAWDGERWAPTASHVGRPSTSAVPLSNVNTQTGKKNKKRKR